MTNEPEFALDGLEPADLDSAQAESGRWAQDLHVLAEHHTPGKERSYIVAHDESVTWGAPGSPQIAAIKITRDFDHRTFTLERDYHAALPFAQAWLIERGCPAERIALPDGVFIEAAGNLTLRTEQKIRDSGQRYEVLDTCTRDYDPYESWTLVRDTLAGKDPIRVFLEQADLKVSTYTLREGAFPDEDAARDWLDERPGPLPQPPEERTETAAERTRAALTRSTDTPHISASGLDHDPPSPAVPTQRQNQGRSL